MKFRLSTLLLLGFMLISCTVTKKIVSTGIQEVSFGGGGGVTGVVREYRLLSSGELLLGDQLLASLPKEEVLYIFSEAKKLSDYEYKKPHNMSLFLSIKQLSGVENRIVWHAMDKDIDPEVSKLYDKLKSFIK